MNSFSKATSVPLIEVQIKDIMVLTVAFCSFSIHAWIPNLALNLASVSGNGLTQFYPPMSKRGTETVRNNLTEYEKSKHINKKTVLTGELEPVV